MASMMAASKVTVEIPFDLNKIFSLTYEFQPLKEVLEYIFAELKRNENRTHVVDTKLVSKLLLLDKLKNENEDNKKDIKQIKTINSELEAKSIAADQELSNIKTDLETCKMNLSLMSRQLHSLPGRLNDVEDKLEEFEKKLKELENKLSLSNVTHINTGGQGGTGPDLDTLNRLLSEFMKKSDMESLLKRLEKCEKKSKKAKDTASKCEKKHKKWKPKWIQMQKDIEELKALLGNKVDYNVFDEEMEKIRNLINSLGSSGKDIKAPIIQSGPSISTKDMNDIKEMMKKVAEHEEKLKNLNLDAIMKKLQALQDEVSKSKTDIMKLENEKAEKIHVDGEFKRVQRELDMLNDWCKRLEEMIQKLMALSYDSQFAKVNQRIDKMEDLIAKLQRHFEDLRSMKTVSSTAHVETRESIGDDFALRDLGMRINGLQSDMDSLRNEFAKWVKEFQDSLNSKADIEALSNLEKLLMDRLNEIVKALTKQLADKNDTKKALKLLERQLKNLYDLFMQKNGQATAGAHEHEDDAMFTKKPLGGMSCASCEKDIINLYGKKVDFLPWNKFPFRDPSERIARVGQGFSKMLSMINPDTLSRYEQNNKFNSLQGQQNGHFSGKNSQEHFYDSQEQMDTVGENMHNNKPGTAAPGGKTMNNFYHAQQMQDLAKRPGSAQVLPKPRVKNNFLRQSNKK